MCLEAASRLQHTFLQYTAKIPVESWAIDSIARLRNVHHDTTIYEIAPALYRYRIGHEHEYMNGQFSTKQLTLTHPLNQHWLDLFARKAGSLEWIPLADLYRPPTAKIFRATDFGSVRLRTCRANIPWEGSSNSLVIGNYDSFCIEELAYHKLNKQVWPITSGSVFLNGTER